MVSKGDPDRFFHRGDPRYRVEILDDDVLLVDIQTGVVHRVPGPDVDLLLAGTPTLMSGHLPPGGADAIRTALSTGTIRRRTLLVGGGALAASGILSTALPFAAAALSFSFLPPYDGTAYSTAAFNASSIATATKDGWPLGGAWTAGRIDTGFANSGSARSVQVVLHATSGTDWAGTGIGAGSGAYIVATVSLPANSQQLRFSLRVGARGNINQTLGHGGVAVGAFLWDGGGATTQDWFLVAGAGGGDGNGGPGGRWGTNGGGTDPGLRAVGTTGGAGGAGSRGELSTTLPATTGQGYNAITGSALLGRSQADNESDPSFINFYASASALGGGGGGAGWASGGGGGNGGGGGGGSSLIKTSGSGPVVTAHSIYSFPRAFADDGSTTRFELYT